MCYIRLVVLAVKSKRSSGLVFESIAADVVLSCIVRVVLLMLFMAMVTLFLSPTLLNCTKKPWKICGCYTRMVPEVAIMLVTSHWIMR